jgi:hypothetical protein
VSNPGREAAAFSGSSSQLCACERAREHEHAKTITVGCLMKSAACSIANDIVQVNGCKSVKTDLDKQVSHRL